MATLFSALSRSCQRAATSRSVKFLFNFVFISAPHAAQRTPFICLEHVSMWWHRGEMARGGGGNQEGARACSQSILQLQIQCRHTRTCVHVYKHGVGQVAKAGPKGSSLHQSKVTSFAAKRQHNIGQIPVLLQICLQSEYTLSAHGNAPEHLTSI